MAFGRFDQGTHNGPQAEINMVPLIDVMLVLLIIFMITAPLMTHRLPIELPAATAQPVSEPLPAIALSLNAQGQLFWGEEPIATETLTARLREAATRHPQPELQISADRNTRYEALAQLMAQAQAAGLSQIGFMTQPGNAQQAENDLQKRKEGL